jgi:hypothetical protein
MSRGNSLSKESYLGAACVLILAILEEARHEVAAGHALSLEARKREVLP